MPSNTDRLADARDARVGDVVVRASGGDVERARITDILGDDDHVWLVSEDGPAYWSAHINRDPNAAVEHQAEGDG